MNHLQTNRPGRVCLFITLLLLAMASCSEQHTDEAALREISQNQLTRLNKQLTEVIVADIFTPPVCSRIYAYANIAAFEALNQGANKYGSFGERLNDLGKLPVPEEEKEYFFPLASAVAFTTVGHDLVYDQDKVTKFEEEYLKKITDAGISKTVYENSVAFGQLIGKHILAWADADGYLQRTALSRYVLEDKPAAWKPTPPDYMPAIEPNWNTLRPFVLDSAQQFHPGKPTNFDTIPSSEFYKETLQVYQAVKEADSSRIEIAKFWDCNPNISHTKGHLTFFDQKISPGGHWISITGIASDYAGLNELKSARVHALVSITLADAFISCWDEKYRSSLIRPETYIKKYIDADWKPILQTPAFPEYTSGHSVASTSAAVILTYLLGESFSFVDSTEVEYGLPVRTFKSFFEASDEAAISRLYGGIHYMPAITNGVRQGKDVGNFIAKKLMGKDFEPQLISKKMTQ